MRWFGGSIVEAVNLSKSKNAIFVVFVEGSNAESKVMADLVETPEVSSRLSEESNFVAIKIVSGSATYTQFAQIYQLVPVPSIFFIGSSGTPLEVFAGNAAKDSTALTSKIDALLASKGGTAPPAKLSQSSSSSTSSAMSSTSAFLSSEQGAIPKGAPSRTTEAPHSNPPQEMEMVCEGEVCVRRPKPVTTTATTEVTATAAATSTGSQSEQKPSISPDGDQTTAASVATSTPSTTADVSTTPVVPTTAAVPTTPAVPTTAAVSTSETDLDKKELSVEEKVERAKELIERKKREKLEEEQKAEREKELERRSQGAKMAELKQWQQEQELKNLKEERLKEKKENEKIRARILEQIAQDRMDRQAKFGNQAESPQTVPTTTVQPPSPTTDTSNTTRLQFKMADGSTHTTQVPSDSTLGELRQYIRENIIPSGSFTLSTMYPRQCLPADKDSSTMRELGLSPSSSLLLLQAESLPSEVGKYGGFFSMITQLFWSMLVAPTADLFRYVSGLLTGRGTQPGRPATTPGSSGAVGGTVRRTQGAQDESNVKRRRVAGDGVSTVRKEGNTYRLKDRDSDDENNTWNGNSTQQM